MMNRVRWIGVAGLLAGCLQVTERPVCVEEVRAVDDSFAFGEWTAGSLAEAVTGEWTVGGQYMGGEPAQLDLVVMQAGPAEHLVRTHDTEVTRSLGFGKNILQILVQCDDELRVPIAVDLQSEDGLVEVWAEGAIWVHDPMEVGFFPHAVEGQATAKLSEATFPLTDEDPDEWEDVKVIVGLSYPPDPSEGEGEAPHGYLGWTGSQVQGDAHVATSERVVEW